MADEELMRALEAESASQEDREASEDSLAQMARLAREVSEIDEQLAEVTESLNALKIRRYAILTRDMIDVMDEAGTELFVVDGTEFRADTKYHASIPKERADEAHIWLDGDGAGDIVKRTVTVTFPKESVEQAEALATYARQRYQDARVETKMEVPWARLTSWFKEQITELGRGDIPLDILGAKIERLVTLKNKRK